LENTTLVRIVIRSLSPALFLVGVLTLCCTLEPPPKRLPVKEVEITGGGVKLKVFSSSGRVTEILDENTGEELLRRWPENVQSSRIGIEIFDELNNFACRVLRDSVVVRSFEEKDNSVVFEKVFAQGTVLVRQKIWGNREGVFFKLRAEIIDEKEMLRSVRLSYLVPLPEGCNFWVPNGADPFVLDGRTAAQFIYGPGAAKGSQISIPMASIWKPGGPGLSFAVPLEVQTVRVTFEIEPGRLPVGIIARAEEGDWLRITFDLVGIGGGRALETGLWIYTHQDDWRDALRIFAEKYQDYFKPALLTLSAQGVLSRIRPGRTNPGLLAGLKKQEVSLAKIDWNFYRPGEWIPPQALRFEDFTWSTRIDPENLHEVSVQLIRSSLENLLEFKFHPILHAAFNQYCERELAETQYGDDIALDESGRPLAGPNGHYLMQATPENTFGRKMIQQQRRMIELYPQAGAFFFDDWGLTGVDFAHKDSLTVAHNRPVYYLSRNLETVGNILVNMVHEAKKLVVATPCEKIVHSRGIDIFCLKDPDPDLMGRVSMMSIWRPVVADFPGAGKLPVEKLEGLLQQELLWGVLPSTGELAADPQLARAYRPLFLKLRGREWLLQPHVLSLPEGVKGQVFLVPAGVHNIERDVVVTVVRPGERLLDELQRGGVVVKLRLPEPESFRSAVWIAASRVPRPVPVRLIRKEDQLVVELPPFGPAGLLRLKRG